MSVANLITPEPLSVTLEILLKRGQCFQQFSPALLRQARAGVGKDGAFCCIREKGAMFDRRHAYIVPQGRDTICFQDSFMEALAQAQAIQPAFQEIEGKGPLLWNNQIGMLLTYDHRGDMMGLCDKQPYKGVGTPACHVLFIKYRQSCLLDGQV